MLHSLNNAMCQLCVVQFFPSVLFVTFSFTTFLFTCVTDGGSDGSTPNSQQPQHNHQTTTYNKSHSE